MDLAVYPHMKNFIEDQVELIRKQVGDKKVLLALSGGVDSSVVAAMLIKAIGQQLVCVHVNHGLMRKCVRIRQIRKCFLTFGCWMINGNHRITTVIQRGVNLHGCTVYYASAAGVRSRQSRPYEKE